MTVFVPTRLVNALNRREHWATRAARARTQRRAVWAAIWKTTGRDEVVSRAPKRITMHAHVWRLMDSDGLSAALKACRDGLMDARVIDDDGPASGHVFDPPTQEVNRRQLGVRITVEPLPGPRPAARREGEGT